MGSRQRVQRLQFSAFRGAIRPTQIRFRADQPITLIFGENGTGKSTIADAIDFVCNNELGSVRLRSGTRPSHVVAAEAGAKELHVELTVGDQTWRARLQGQSAVTTPADPPRAFVLRRADITRIMEATDSQRYSSLQEFITVPQIEKAEKTLRAAGKTAAAEVEQAKQQKRAAEETLQEIWTAEGRSGDDFLAWARIAVQQPIAAVEAEIKEGKALLAALDRAVAADQRVKTTTVQLAQTRAEYAALNAEFRQVSQTTDNADLMETLAAAGAYLEQHPEADHCPVCAKAEPRSALLATIDVQLAQLQQVQRLQRRVEHKLEEGKGISGAHAAARQAWQAAYADLSLLLITAPDTLVAGIELAEVEFGEEVDGLDAAAIHATLDALAARQPQLAARIAQAEKTLGRHNALSAHLATIDRLADAMVTAANLDQRLTDMLAVIEEERKRYVEETVNSISGTVSQLYRRIHPDEPLGNPSFALKDRARASLTLSSTFGDHENVPPAAYYSESHLDTLGLCVYLALAKQSGDALVVLDDVLTSIDAPHLDRVIKLINEEAPNFGHVIITTHERSWFDRMRYGQGMRAELIELYGWDLQSGIHHSAAPLAIDELRDAVEARRLDRQAVASRAGVLLEQMLDELTLRYQCSLPRKRPAAYTLGELAQGFDKKLRKLLRTEEIDGAGDVIDSRELYPLIEAAASGSWIRNQVGAHFNPNAAGISDAMAANFGRDVITLAEALLCPHCNQLPRRDKSGSYLECGGGCGRRRLFPLRTP